MDLLWNSIDAGAPVAIEVDPEVSDQFNPDITPVKLKVTFDHPANHWRGPVQVVWYQGGLKPPAPKGYIDVSRIANGAIFEGSRGTILADFTTRVIIPNNDDGDMTYYKRRSAGDTLPLIGGTGQITQAPPAARAGRAGAGRGAAGGGRGAAGGGRGQNLPPGFTAMPSSEVGPSGFPTIQMSPDKVPADLILPNANIEGILAAEQAGRPNPPSDIFQSDWLNACKGKSNSVVHGTSSKTHCDFDYSGTMMEQMLLGLVAHRAGKKLTYDPATGRITNLSEANDWLKRPYRSGWTLNG
jgi:hypothetical protein